MHPFANPSLLGSNGRACVALLSPWGRPWGAKTCSRPATPQHIYRFTPNGAYTSFATSSGYITPAWLLTAPGNLYYGNTGHGQLL